MSDILENNLAAIDARWPDLAALLRQQDVMSLPADLCEGRESTLRVGGIQLSSRHDRAGEARMQADSLPEGLACIHLYGPGLGDLPRALLGRPGLQRLVVHLLNDTLFALILHLLDQTDWLADPRVDFVVSNDGVGVVSPFIAAPAELVLASDAHARTRDHLMSEMAIPFVNSHQRFDLNNAESQGRIAANLELLRGDRDVAELFGSLPDSEMLVLASGPTLASHYEALRDFRKTHPAVTIISVDTALRPLLDNGIRPDWVVSADDKIDERILPPEESSGIGLVYFPMVGQQVLAMWRGPRYATYSQSPIYDVVRRQVAKAKLFIDGSVLHPAVDLAVRMGARRVILMGADFSYVGERMHAGWEDGQIADLAATPHWVLNGYGERVPTQLNLRAYLCSLESYIAAHPEVRFFNTSRAGAWITGASLHPELTV